VKTYARLVLGTAQWGASYGMANRTGPPSTSEIHAMLRLAGASGITLLDTAPAYGDAESIVGELSDVTGGKLAVVTKTQQVRSSPVRESDVARVSAALTSSMERLKAASVYGVLVHYADSLLAPGGHLIWNALRDLQHAGKASRIGVSVYRPEQLESILERYRVDLVQLPFNIYDQRFARAGMLARLKDAGVEVHARSAFLQGLLLADSASLPPYFAPISRHHATLRARLDSAGVTPLAACLRFSLTQDSIDAVVVGCESSQQLIEVLAGAENTAADDLGFQQFALEDARYIDPSCWPAMTAVAPEKC
jgi:aryl-alcohol dehydrogenase-like predicted oxidoreductase